MQVQALKMKPGKAAELYRAYKSHKAYQKPEDYEIMRTYQLIAQGKVVIQALESIRQAGLNAQGLPCLAIARADAEWCHLQINTRGGGCFSGKQYVRGNSRDKIEFPNGFFSNVPKEAHSFHRIRAAVPHIPPQHRPQRGIENYHILWEAEWDKVPPVDPYLLRRVGKGDMWLVVAAWDLTPVERAAMNTRILAS